MSRWTPKKAAIIGLVLSGASVVFLFALVVAMNWPQGRSPGHKDWSIVSAAAFGVPFVCCSVAAVLSFVVSVSLVTYQRLFGLREAPSVALMPEPHRRKVRHPAIISFAGFAVLMLSVRFGPVAVCLVGFPVMFLLCGIAAGARSPTKIPLRDAVLYVGISIAVVIAITIYAMYHH